MNNMDMESYEELVMTQFLNEATRHSPRKRDASDNGVDYNYDNLLNEYYEETKYEMKSDLTYHIGNKATSRVDFLNLIHELFGKRNKNVADQSTKCLFKDCKTQRYTFESCAERLWKILGIWFIMYLVLAVPLWCTRGICCCCLCCKFFKPQKTIEDAKLYLVANPPGLLKTSRGNEILYEPSQSERDYYEEFEHLIRTI